MIVSSRCYPVWAWFCLTWRDVVSPNVLFSVTLFNPIALLHTAMTAYRIEDLTSVRILVYLYHQSTHLTNTPSIDSTAFALPCVFSFDGSQALGLAIPRQGWTSLEAQGLFFCGFFLLWSFEEPVKPGSSSTHPQHFDIRKAHTSAWDREQKVTLTFKQSIPSVCSETKLQVRPFWKAFST